MKRLISILLSALSFLLMPAFADSANKELLLNIKFDAAPNGTMSDKPFHIDKTITINPATKTNTIIMSQSKIENDLPVTLVMMVKPVSVKKHEATLQFCLVQYGMTQRGSVITQPMLVIKNGQSGEIKIDNTLDLKVSASIHQSA
jgi:hypothetical protein